MVLGKVFHSINHETFVYLEFPALKTATAAKKAAQM